MYIVIRKISRLGPAILSASIIINLLMGDNISVGGITYEAGMRLEAQDYLGHWWAPC